KRLAPIASLAAQRRFIVNGTTESYLVPDELLEDVADVVRQVRDIPRVRNKLSEEASRAILDAEQLLSHAQRALRDRDTDPAELIERNEAWRSLRRHIAHCIET